MGQSYPDDYFSDDVDQDDVGQDDVGQDDVDQDHVDEDDEITPRPSNRGAVGIFLLGWLFLPTAGVLLSDLQSPWFEVAGLVTLLFIAVFVAAVVRVVKNF